MAAAIEEGELVLEGIRVFCRRVAGEGTPVVYVTGSRLSWSGVWESSGSSGGSWSSTTGAASL